MGVLCGGVFCHSTGYLRNRGVTGDFHRPYATQKPFPFTIHRTTLPQSRFRSTAPSEREPGNAPHNVNHPPAGCCVSGRVIFGGSVWGCVLPFNRVLAKPWGYGRFSSPLRNSKTVSFCHSSDDTPSVSHSLDSSLREGAGMGAYHSSDRPATGRFRAIFIAPTKTQKFLHSTVHRGTFPQGGSRRGSEKNS